MDRSDHIELRGGGFTAVVTGADADDLELQAVHQASEFFGPGVVYEVGQEAL